MVKSHERVSDLIFSPGRAPQIEMNGQLVELKYKGLESLTPQDTLTIAHDIMGKNETALRKLEQEGSADISYGVARRGALPREYFSPARQLRDRHARYTRQNS